MACSKSSEKMEDFFGNVPDLVIDKILENLPIHMAAQTSVLSKKWRRAWLSLEHLIFDFEFQEQLENEDGSCNWQKCSRIISRILLHHNGPVRRFDLIVPEDADEDHMNLSQWISFLSRNGVQMILIYHWDCEMYIPSNIFWCSELVYLELDKGTINPPPTCFHGFPKLKHLELQNVVFTKQNTFCSLIENCRMLVTLILCDWVGMDHVVIDAPSLQTLTLVGDFESLAFRNVCTLKSISMCLRKLPEKLGTGETADAVNLLASSCQLQSVKFNAHLCQVTSGKNVGQHIVDFNYNYKLDQLHEVSIKGITGSSAELKLVEYLLAISPVLENMFFKSGKLVKSCNPIDKEALLDFKLRITNDPLGLLDSWSPATDCCTAWQGVACDNGRVVNVSRSGIVYDSEEDDMVMDMRIFMSGTLSPFLANLTYLQVLDFRALQNLTGPIPLELGKLSNLTHLHLYRNQLSGSITSSFRHFPKLKLLSLSDNNLMGIIPELFFQTSTLMVELDLSRNQLSGPLPSSIGMLTSLTTLRLSNNHLSGVIPTSIGDLASLLTLELGDNKLTGVLPDSIGNLPKIETINLVNNMITGHIPSSLGNLSTIYTLKLSDNHFIGEIPSSFGNLKNLETLELMRNQIVGPIPPNLDKVTVLGLSYNPLELGGVPNWLLKFKNLKGLELASTGIKGELTMLPLSLNYLDLSSNELTGKLPSWIGNMRDLQELNLSYNQFNSTIPEELGYLEYLDRMSLSSNSLHGSIPGKLLNLKYWQVFDVSKNRLTGKIPIHKFDLPISGFMGNPGLCDAPLPPCKFV
ncbi:hypothetical protein KSS87_013808 [Heliosperma pusillum]|nr:hypothetical protein KSS87_013808 [Heliosperma pusillum]